MSVKVTILYDNRCDNVHLQEGWGFSALIEFNESKILFDTGGDVSAFSSNLQKMQISYREVTHLLFSHRHWDHIAGSKEIIKELGQHTALYVPKRFPWWLASIARLYLKKVKVVCSFEEIAPNIYSLVLKGGFWLYEQVLILKTAKGLGIIPGCAHPGIIQIIKAAQEHLQSSIYFVLGGFHVKQSVDIVKQFQVLNVQNVAPCHCSGDLLIRQFQDAFGSNFSKIGTGTILHF